MRLGFEWGVRLQDEDGLLAPGGKPVRYVELADADAVPESGISRLLLEAVSLKLK